MFLSIKYLFFSRVGGIPGNSDAKESASNAGDPGSVNRSGRYPGEGNATQSTLLAWRIPWTEKPGRYNLWGHKALDTTELLTFTC